MTVRYGYETGAERNSRTVARGAGLRARSKAYRLYHLIMLREDHITTGVHVPEPIHEISTERLLTMTWLEGERLAVGCRETRAENRNAIASNVPRLVHAFLFLWRHSWRPASGQLHGTKDNSINLLDYGCVRVFKPELVPGVIKLYPGRCRKAAMNLRLRLIRRGVLSIPATRWSRPLIYGQIHLCSFLEDKIRPIEETNTGLYGRETASKVHQELRKIGGVTVPREFVFMDVRR